MLAWLVSHPQYCKNTNKNKEALIVLRKRNANGEVESN
jgi:hypothetical protein